MLRRLLLTLGLFEAIVATPTTIYAAENSEPWTVSCDQDGCLISQFIDNPEIENLRVGLIFRKPSGGSTVLGRLIVPLGVKLALGAQLDLQGKEFGSVAYETCVKGGCYTDFHLSDDDILSLSKSQQLGLTLWTRNFVAHRALFDITSLGNALTQLDRMDRAGKRKVLPSELPKIASIKGTQIAYWGSTIASSSPERACSTYVIEDQRAIKIFLKDVYQVANDGSEIRDSKYQLDKDEIKKIENKSREVSRMIHPTSISVDINNDRKDRSSIADRYDACNHVKRMYTGDSATYGRDLITTSSFSGRNFHEASPLLLNEFDIILNDNQVISGRNLDGITRDSINLLVSDTLSRKISDSAYVK